MRVGELLPLGSKSPYLHIGVLLRGQVKDPPGVVVQALQQVVKTEPAFAHGGQQQRQHGLKPWEAGGRPGPTLLLQSMGCWEKEHYPQYQSPPHQEVTQAAGMATSLPTLLLTVSGNQKTGKWEPTPFTHIPLFIILLICSRIISVDTDQAPIPDRPLC